MTSSPGWSRAISPDDALNLPPPAREDFDRLFLLGTDHHEVPVSLERILENLMDWEHHPFVHPQAFTSSELLDGGPGWYRVRLGNAPATSGTANDALIVLQHRESGHARWIIMLEEGPQAGYLTYTKARRLGPDRIATEIDFYVPDKPRNAAVQRAVLGFYKKQYAGFYLQDTKMMSERQQALDAHAHGRTEVGADGSIGPVEAVRRRAPFALWFRGQRFWIRSRDPVTY